MRGFQRGPICGKTNPSFKTTPGTTGCNDDADPNNGILIPDTRSSFGLSSGFTGILLAQVGGVTLPSKGKTSKYKDPFNPITAVDFAVGRERVTLYQYEFPSSTSLEFALEWILKNSIQTITDYKISKGIVIKRDKPLNYYREVSLFWQLQSKRFIAYTLNRETVTIYDARISKKNMIFVAHTHPTKKDLPPSKIVSWSTTAPSPNDVSGFMPNQMYSVILHRDLKHNKTPCAFIYDRNKKVYSTRYKDVAAEYIKLEKAAGTRAADVGRYK